MPIEGEQVICSHRNSDNCTYGCKCGTGHAAIVVAGGYCTIKGHCNSTGKTVQCGLVTNDKIRILEK